MGSIRDALVTRRLDAESTEMKIAAAGETASVLPNAEQLTFLRSTPTAVYDLSCQLCCQSDKAGLFHFVTLSEHFGQKLGFCGFLSKLK